MTDISEVNNWYAIFVKSGQEDKVKERIIYRFGDELKVLVPKRKLRERRGGVWYFRTRTLFPGYVLLNGNINADAFPKFRNVPGLFKLLSSEREPLRIEPWEMEVLERLICNGEEIGLSQLYMEGDKIKVVDGPLLSMEGYIISVDSRKGRAKVRMDFLGEERTVELGISLIKPDGE